MLRKSRTYLAIRSTCVIPILALFGAVLVGGVLLTVGQSFLPHSTEVNADTPWTLQDIENFLGASIPTDATEVDYYSLHHYSVLVRLNFKSPPEDLARFTERFCGGMYYQGYSPFNAVNVKAFTADSHPIDMGNFTYYSYSPALRTTDYGNRCFNPKIGLIHILVDKANPTLYTIKFLSSFGCNFVDNGYLPCDQWAMYDMRPVLQSPIIVRGLEVALEDGRITLPYSDLCFDIDPHIAHDPLSTADNLVNADVKISIDDEVMPSAYISDGMRIRPISDRGNDAGSGNIFAYCVKKDWQQGVHTVNIQVITSLADHASTWSFMVRRGLPPYETGCDCRYSRRS